MNTIDPHTGDMMFEKAPDPQALQNEHKAMREAMQWFVDRVDAGEVRSRRTYAKFKEILASLRTR